mgnify:FL=1|jgi:hypothetical protein
MPYFGRAPAAIGIIANRIAGDLKVAGTISGESINYKVAMDTAAVLDDHIVIEDGGTDGSATNAGDNILLEDVSDDSFLTGGGQLNANTGFAATIFDHGTVASLTVNLSAFNGNFQKVINGGAHTLVPQVEDSTIVLQYTNNASAGTLTTSGFTVATGDDLTTTNGHDFFLYCTKMDTFKQIHVVALQ